MSAKPREKISAELLIVPDPQVQSEVFLVARDASKGESAFYFSNNGGKTFKALIPAPTEKSRPGAVLTLNDDLSSSWQFQTPGNKSVTTSSTAGGSFFVPFTMMGDIYSGAILGYFKVPAGKSAVMREIQVIIQDVADQAIIVDVVNGSNIPQARSASLAAGLKHLSFTFATPLVMSSRSIWSMKVLNCGTSSAPGTNLTILAGIEYTS